MADATRSIRVVISAQQLELRESGALRASWPVSTSRAGPGERQGSERTPRGRHEVRAKIGDGAPLGTVFVGRRATGEIWTPALGRTWPDRDWILTRILWLRGLEPGLNRGGDVDSMRRTIYIHGTPDAASLGRPVSHGCVRMRNEDVVALFDAVEVGTVVEIEAD